MTGAPAPYCMANDNIIQLLLILNLVGIAYALLMNGMGILERTKCIFYYENKSTPYNDRTHITRICNTLLDFQFIFYATIVATAVVDEHCFDITSRNSLQVTGTLAAMFTAFLLIKRAMHTIVNNILYTKGINEEWNSFYFFTIKLLGFTLTPAVIAILFMPEISFTFVKIYLLIVLAAYVYTILNGLFKIIFAQRRNFLDIFLYLCALEFLPMGIVWKSILQVSEFLTIKN